MPLTGMMRCGVRRNKLLLASGVAEGFSVRDLVRRDPRHIRRDLSAIINFHKFRDDRLAVYQDFSEQTVRRRSAWSRAHDRWTPT